MVEKLCQKFGTLLLKHEDVEYYNFPSIESLADPQVEPQLRTMGFGYRAKFIQQSAVKILANGGRDWLFGLRSVPYAEAKSALMTLPGIGAKVSVSINCNFQPENCSVSFTVCLLPLCVIVFVFLFCQPFFLLSFYICIHLCRWQIVSVWCH